MKKTTDEKIDDLSKHLTTQFDEKIDDLSKSLMKKFDEKIDEFARMVAHGFSQVHSELSEMRADILGVKKEIKAMNKTFEKHARESEKIHRGFDKRMVVLERLQNI